MIGSASKMHNTICFCIMWYVHFISNTIMSLAIDSPYEKCLHTFLPNIPSSFSLSPSCYQFFSFYHAFLVICPSGPYWRWWWFSNYHGNFVLYDNVCLRKEMKVKLHFVLLTLMTCLPPQIVHSTAFCSAVKMHFKKKSHFRYIFLSFKIVRISIRYYITLFLKRFLGVG